jgi:hypothetical protein
MVGVLHHVPEALAAGVDIVAQGTELGWWAVHRPK